MHHQFLGSKFCFTDCPPQQFRRFFRKGFLNGTKNLLILKVRG